MLSTLVSPAFLLGDTPLLAELVEKSDARGTAVSNALGPAARRALQAFLEAVRVDERNAAWAPAIFVEGEALREIHREGIYVLYRLLFVLFAEAANALPLDKPLYREAYSLERMRDEFSADVAFADNSYALWDGVKALIRLVDSGAQTDEFRIPAYNGGLFGAKHTLVLDGAWVSDRAFAEVLRELTTVRLGTGRRATRDRVSFRELGVGQLGAVFEGLLDYEPHVAREELFEVPTGTGKAKGISFLPMSALGAVKNLPESPDVHEREFYLQAWGGQRKSTGAYYTPCVIADYLVREALRPQVEGLSSDAILEIAVCDPAMGSGGFLVSATEFLGDAYYRARIAEGTFDADDERAEIDRVAAKRIVAERCIYGVDVNPMAVELAKVSLWLTTLSYDRPLSFFDHHLRCGNSLLGAPLRDDRGAITSDRIRTIPVAALAPVDKEATKDERAAQQRIAKRNAAQLKAIELGGNRSLFMLDLAEPLAEYAAARKRLSADDPTQSAQDAVELIRAKERRLRDLTEDPRSPFFKLKEIADLWMSPWFWPHDPAADTDGNPVEPPTTDDYATMASEIWSGGPRSESGQRILDESRRLSRGLRFFHWEIEFPEVFERGGFHAVVGNPPWETLSPKTQEFFSNYDPLFRTYSKQRAVERMNALRAAPSVEASYRRYARDSYHLAAYLKTAGIYTWYAQANLGKGDFDLFRAFVERDHKALRRTGSVAQVVPSGFYMNSNCAEVRRQMMFEAGSIRSLVANQNERFVFAIEHGVKFALLVADRSIERSTVEVAFFTGKDEHGMMRARSASQLAEVLASSTTYLIQLPLALIQGLSPQTLAIPELAENLDVALVEHLWRNGIQFSEAFERQYCVELHMTGDSHLFIERDQLEAMGATFDGLRWYHTERGEFWPLIEGKHFYQNEFPVGQFRYWIEARHSQLLPKFNSIPVNHFERLAWRDIASSGNERTLIAAEIPGRSFANHKAPTFRGGLMDSAQRRILAQLLNSFVFDRQIRIRGATTITFTLLDTMRVPPSIHELTVDNSDKATVEALLLAAYKLPFKLAEHVMSGFPLLDRLEPALPGERRSTVTRDLVLARYAEVVGDPKASWYRERADRATSLGARPFVPETRDVSETAEPTLEIVQDMA